MNKIKNINFHEYYYFAAVFGYVLTLAITSFRPGIYSAVLMALVTLLFIIRRPTFKPATVDVLMGAYFLYNIISVIWLLSSGMTMYVFASEFISASLPMVFYLFGRVCTDRSDDFYKKYLYAVLILCIVSLILYVIAPQFYADYLFRWSYISKADASTTRVRMESITGSTVFGAVNVIGMCISSHFIMKKDTMKKGIIFMAICLIFAFLSNMRSAMVVAILIIVFLNHLLFFTFKTFKKRYFFIECGSIAAAVILVFVIKSDLIMKIYYRLVSLPGAIGQRSEQWVAAVNTMYSTWLGNGLGANSHHALGFEDAHVVADGGLIKLYCEMGIIGTSLILYILILLYQKGLKRLKETFTEIAVISSVILLSIGSNVLCFQLTGPILWYALGRLAYLTLNDASDSSPEKDNDNVEEMA